MDQTATRGFHKLCLSTLVAVYFLILVGGIVRSTGSGMGCPDWPRCFGRWVPPTSAAQLPDNYKETYSAFRQKKNEKFVKYLSALGFRETADKIRNDKSILTEADFNAAKTWTEYINRLVGVAIGLFIILLFVRSWSLRKAYPRIFVLSLAALVTVIFQGWLGSIVVSTNLTTWTITLHMFLALLLVGLLVYLYHISATEPPSAVHSLRLKALLGLNMVLLLVQIFLGTSVRESIDILASRVGRAEWIEGLGTGFLVHRSFSNVIVIASAFLVLKLRKSSSEKALSRVLIILILSTLLTGAGMGYFDVPPYLQPVHLLLASLTFGVQLLVLFRQFQRPLAIAITK